MFFCFSCNSSKKSSHLWESGSVALQIWVLLASASPSHTHSVTLGLHPYMFICMSDAQLNTKPKRLPKIITVTFFEPPFLSQLWPTSVRSLPIGDTEVTGSFSNAFAALKMNDRLLLLMCCSRHNADAHSLCSQRGRNMVSCNYWFYIVVRTLNCSLKPLWPLSSSAETQHFQH